MICALCACEREALAESLLRRMRTLGLRPEPCLFREIMRTYAHKGLSVKAQDILWLMEDSGVEIEEHDLRLVWYGFDNGLEWWI